MKIYILISALVVSFYIASCKEKTSGAVLKSNKLLYDIAEKLKESAEFSLSPVSNIISEVLNYSGISTSEFDEFSATMNILRSVTSNALEADEIYDKITDINGAVIANIEEKCENMVKITRLNYEKAYESYQKCKKTAFYVYPGITAIIAIVFI